MNEPSAPFRINVPNHATSVSITPTFSWYESARAIKYHLQVSTTPDFSNIVKNENSITGTSLILSGLSYNTTYFWRMNAIGAGGTSDWSENWSFTTSVSTGIS